jgi:hypothetical protein
MASLKPIGIANTDDRWYEHLDSSTLHTITFILDLASAKASRLTSLFHSITSQLNAHQKSLSDYFKTGTQMSLPACSKLQSTS